MPALTMDTKNVMMSALLFLVISLVPLVNGGCTSKFGAPKVEQVALDKVKVSWDDVVDDLDCVDSFVINYWEEDKSKVDGTFIHLGTNQFSTEIKVTPRQRYKFQLKTKQRSTWYPYGESKTVEFITSRNKQGSSKVGGPGGVNPTPSDDTPIEIKYYFIAICGVIGGLIVIGIIYKLVCKYACNKKSSADLEMSLD